MIPLHLAYRLCPSILIPNINPILFQHNFIQYHYIIHHYPVFFSTFMLSIIFYNYNFVNIARIIFRKKTALFCIFSQKGHFFLHSLSYLIIFRQITDICHVNLLTHTDLPFYPIPLLPSSQTHAPSRNAGNKSGKSRN